MKIRDKLFLAFSLYVFLAVILGFFAYKELHKIGTRLTLVEIADDITNTILEVRRYEKNFLLYKDKNDLNELKKYLGSLKENIDNIKGEISSEIGGDNYEMMKRAMAEYEHIINTIPENFESQAQLTSLVTGAGKRSERVLSGPELQALLVVRRYEKNVMLYKDQKIYDAFTKGVNALPLAKYPEIADYGILMSKLYNLYEEEKRSVENMRSTAREIQFFTQNLSKKERADIAATIKHAINLLLFALIVIIILGTIINIKLDANIATPIRKLEQITKKIAEGDFSENIEVKGKDELASLEISFNQMEDRLRDALTSLEYTIEKLKEKQAQLVEAEKLASVGILCKGIAHEINNPLTSVLTFSNLMLEQTPENDPRSEKLRMMARETERARNIVRQLLNFGKDMNIRPVRININQPVTEIIDSLVAQGALKDIKLNMNLSENLPEIYLDPAQIGQVVLNLMLNAIHAVTPPGQIEVMTRASEKFLEVVFSDSGSGISKEHLNKIFDPFFTTKDSSRGTGLGLAVSYGIIKKHGGDISVMSAVGQGSTFIVRLPINTE